MYAANELSVYVQDDWRARSWLTLNLGLRYDYYAPLTEADNQISNVDLAAGAIRRAGEGGFSDGAGVEPDRGNISPRLGFAATVDKDTVVRGGYALSFSPPFVGTPLAFRNPPFVNLVNISPSTFAPINRLSEGLPPLTPADAANPTGNLAPVAFDLHILYVHQFNIALQRQLPWQMAVTGAFVKLVQARRGDVAPNQQRTARGRKHRRPAPLPQRVPQRGRHCADDERRDDRLSRDAPAVGAAVQRRLGSAQRRTRWRSRTGRSRTPSIRSATSRRARTPSRPCWMPSSTRKDRVLRPRRREPAARISVTAWW